MIWQPGSLYKDQSVDNTNLDKNVLLFNSNCDCEKMQDNLCVLQVQAMHL